MVEVLQTARPPAQDDVPRWARDRLDEQQREIERLKRRLRVWEEIDHVPKKVFSHSQKATVRSALKIIQEGTPRPDGLIEFHISDLGGETDQERKTIGAHLKRANAIGVLRYHTEKERNTKGEVISIHVFLGPTLLTFDPLTWRAPGDLARQVGAASHCPYCQSVHIRTRVIRECLGCGRKLSDTGDGTGTAMLDLPEDDIPYPDEPLDDDEPESKYWTLVSESDEPESANRPVIPSPPPKGEIWTLDSPAPEAAAEADSPPARVLDLSKHQAVSFFSEEDETPARSAQETFEQAAALLVQIAGDEQQHAVMNRLDKDDNYQKYGPVWRRFTLGDARKHLRGESTRAARLRRKDGTTRALCFDGDSSEEYTRLTGAGQLLLCAGVTSLLEKSPARGGHAGGGALWIIFDGLVEARCALRFVCEIAPMLVGLEYWPGPAQNRRLPGGVYVTPEFRKQCCLYDASGDLIASTNKEAAAVILDYQTPAGRVPNYPPDPEPENAANRSDSKLLTTSAEVHSSSNPTREQLIAAFNATHDITDFLPSEIEHKSRGSYMARGTWRAEKGRPSVEVYPATNSAYDYGTRERLDCFDVARLVEGKSKSEKLRQWRKEYLAAGQQEQNVSDQAREIGEEVGSTLCVDLPVKSLPVSDVNQDQEHETDARAGATCLEAGDFPPDWKMEDPCKKCGCPLHYESGKEPYRYSYCVRCTPPGRYSGVTQAEPYQQMLDERWPRCKPENKPVAIEFGGRRADHAA